MGVVGLWKALDGATRRSHLSTYAGHTAAIDASVWLHRAAYGCAMELALGRQTDRYIRYCVKRLEMLRFHEITPIMVFDGLRSVLKNGTVTERRTARDAARLRGEQLLREASEAPNEEERARIMGSARDQFQRCVGVTPAMEAALLRELRRRGVRFVVAPYEADAQIVYLVLAGDADLVITEDSDCAAYLTALGLACPVLTKLDDRGSLRAVNVVEALRAARDLCTALGLRVRPAGVFVPPAPPAPGGKRARGRGATAGKLRRAASRDIPDDRFLAELAGLTPRMFIQACCLAGCDYVPALPNVGLKTALKLVQAHADAPDDERVARIVAAYAGSRQGSGSGAPAGYARSVALAEALFFHQRVYCRRRGRLVPLTPLPAGVAPDAAARGAGADARGGGGRVAEARVSPGRAAAVAAVAAAVCVCEARGHGPHLPAALFLREGTDFLGPAVGAARARAVATGAVDPRTGARRDAGPSSQPGVADCWGGAARGGRAEADAARAAHSLRVSPLQAPPAPAPAVVGTRSAGPGQGATRALNGDAALRRARRAVEEPEGVDAGLAAFAASMRTAAAPLPRAPPAPARALALDEALAQTDAPRGAGPAASARGDGSEKPAAAAPPRSASPARSVISIASSPDRPAAAAAAAPAAAEDRPAQRRHLQFSPVLPARAAPAAGARACGPVVGAVPGGGRGARRSHAERKRSRAPARGVGKSKRAPRAAGQTSMLSFLRHTP